MGRRRARARRRKMIRTKQMPNFFPFLLAREKTLWPLLHMQFFCLEGSPLLLLFECNQYSCPVGCYLMFLFNCLVIFLNCSLWLFAVFLLLVWFQLFYLWLGFHDQFAPTLLTVSHESLSALENSILECERD